MTFKAKPPRNKVKTMAHHYDWGREDEDEILLRKEREAREAMKAALAEESEGEQDLHQKQSSK